MEKNELKFEDFLNDISPESIGLVTHIHDFLSRSGCAIKLQLAKSGHVVSYSDPASKKVVANFVSRKGGPVIRIYGDHLSKYIDYIENMPAEMIKAIEKAPVCRRLVDPEKCNSKCPMGFEFTLKGELLQKCRYGCFMFQVTTENNPYILSLLEKEVADRTA